MRGWVALVPRTKRTEIAIRWPPVEARLLIYEQNGIRLRGHASTDLSDPVLKVQMNPSKLTVIKKVPVCDDVS